MQKKYLLVGMTFAALTAKAQQATSSKDSVLKGSTIEVIQAYKPQVKQAPKPEWIPQLPPADTTHTTYSYEVPQQTLYYTYSSLPLRPLALGRDTTPLPFANYIKAGAGNLSTIFVDAGIGSIHGKDYETAIHLHHLSQKGLIKYQQTSLTGMEADGMLHKQKADWHGALIAERNQYYFYGYDHAAFDFPKDSIRQAYTTVRVCADVANKKDSNTVINYHPAINASLYTARFNTSEATLGLNAPFSYVTDSGFEAMLVVSGAFTNYRTNGVNFSNNYIEGMPGIKLHTGAVEGNAMLGIALGAGSKLFVLPDLRLAYHVPNSKFIFSAGWQASLRQNTYEQLTTENPYLYSYYPILQTRRDEVYADLQGSKGDHLSFEGRVSWWNYNNLATFLNDSGDTKQFYVSYVDVKALSLRVAARYHVANIWSVGGSADFYNFYGNTQTKVYVWHVPSMKIKGDFTISPIPKFTVTAYLAVLGGIYARDIAKSIVNLDMVVDLGGNAEYQIIPRLSAFAQVNNILNDKYQRWFGYPVYGINIYGGLRLKF